MAKQNKNPNPISLQDFKRLVKPGIKRVESDGRYNLVNDKSQNGKAPTYALGAYQFVPSHHWDKIVEFANKNPKFKKLGLKKVDFSKGWKMKYENKQKEFDKFLNNKELQDAFMDDHIERGYDLAMKAYHEGGKDWNANPLQIFAMMHHQGDSNIVQKIKRGGLNYKSADGTHSPAYMKKFNAGVYEAVGLKKDAKGNYLGTAKQRNEAIMQLAKNPKNTNYQDASKVKVAENPIYAAYRDFKDQLVTLDELNKSGQIDNDTYRSEKKRILDANKSNLADFNKLTHQENTRYRQQQWNKVREGQEAVNIFNKATFKTEKGTGKIIGLGVTIDSDKLTVAEKEYIEKNDIFGKVKDGKYYIKDFKSFNNVISNAYEVAGLQKFKTFHWKGNDFFLNQQFKINDDKYDLNPNTKYGGLVSPLRSDILNNIDYSSFNKGLEYVSYDGLQNITNPFDNSQEDPNAGLDLNGDEPYSYSGRSSFSSSSSGGSEPHTPPVSKSKDGKTAEDIMQEVFDHQKKKEEDAKKEEQDALNQDTLDKLADSANTPMKEPLTYNKDSYDQTKDLPIGDIANSLAGVIVGRDMEDTPYEERDEEVNQAYLSWASQMAEISKRGLSVEDEAAAKDAIAQAYTSGLEQITRASGGNRNVVLGNLGRLDAQKSQNLTQLAVEDAKMKMEGLKAYGEATKYINEFDSNRDIANNQRAYEIAQERRRNGGDLTAAAWSSLSSTMQNYENNKPGSVNHMLMSEYLTKAYGYDPRIKDDGTGNTPNSLSWMKKQNETANQRQAQEVSLNERLGNLNQKGRDVIADFLRKTKMGNLDGAIAFADHLSNVGEDFNYDDVYKDTTTYFADNVKQRSPDNIVTGIASNGTAEPQQQGEVGQIARSEKPSPFGFNFMDIINGNQNQNQPQFSAQSLMQNPSSNFGQNQNQPTSSIWDSLNQITNK